MTQDHLRKAPKQAVCLTAWGLCFKQDTQLHGIQQNVSAKHGMR